MQEDENAASLDRQKSIIAAVADEISTAFNNTHDARENALRLSREVIRNSATSIRATHRGEFEDARRRLNAVTALADEMKQTLDAHQSVFYAGFVEDALKEYVEANATLAFAEGSPLPTPAQLGVGPAPYINGLAEAVGELRRFVLDSMRRDDFSRCEELLEIMDDVYTVLVTMDYPDAVTRGLRRNTDMVRGVLERTRGDLTVTMRQKKLEERLERFENFTP